MDVLFVICQDKESLLEKIGTCHKDPEDAPTTKVNKHTARGYSLFTHSSLIVIEINMITAEVKTV